MTLMFTSPAALARGVAVAASTANPLLPVLTSVQAGALAAVFVTRADAAWPSGVIKRCRHRPTLVILGADAGDDTDPLPADWLCVPKFRSWLSGGSLIVHAAGGEASHYRLACRKAQLARHAAVVECTPSTARAWAEALACPDSLLIRPRDGVHPVAPRAEVRH